MKKNTLESKLYFCAETHYSECSGLSHMQQCCAITTQHYSLMLFVTAGAHCLLNMTFKKKHVLEVKVLEKLDQRQEDFPTDTAQRDHVRKQMLVLALPLRGR